jgi:hypothetical protein
MKAMGPRRLPFTLTEEEAFELPPPRRTLCPKYETCLDHAAERLWTSFTCRGCLMEELILLGKVKELSPPKVRSTIVFDNPVYLPSPPLA